MLSEFKTLTNGSKASTQISFAFIVADIECNAPKQVEPSWSSLIGRAVLTYENSVLSNWMLEDITGGYVLTTLYDPYIILNRRPSKIVFTNTAYRRSEYPGFFYFSKTYCEDKGQDE